MLPTIKLRLNKTVTVNPDTNTRTQQHTILYYRKGKLGFRQVKVVHKPVAGGHGSANVATNTTRLGECKGYANRICHVF